MARFFRAGQCSRCYCQAFTRRIISPGAIDAETGITIIRPFKSSTDCECYHHKSEHRPGWFGRPLIRMGRGGPVLFNRSLLILGPLALSVISAGNHTITETVNGKTHIVSALIPRLVATFIALLILAASSPPARVALGWIAKVIGIAVRTVVVLAVIAIAVAVVVIAGIHFHWWK
jgi:hypothetical protein